MVVSGKEDPGARCMGDAGMGDSWVGCLVVRLGVVLVGRWVVRGDRGAWSGKRKCHESWLTVVSWWAGCGHVLVGAVGGAGETKNMPGKSIQNPPGSCAHWLRLTLTMSPARLRPSFHPWCAGFSCAICCVL